MEDGVDTSLESPDDFCDSGTEVPLMSQAYLVTSRSVAVLSRPEGVKNRPWLSCTNSVGNIPRGKKAVRPSGVVSPHKIRKRIGGLG
jgi:hypothetical protein